VAAKATVDAANDFGVTPLLEASRNGDAPMVDLLLRAGADPEADASRGGDAAPERGALGQCARPCACCWRAAVDVNAAEKFQGAHGADVGRG
jgi:hypothetical protein